MSNESVALLLVLALFWAASRLLDRVPGGRLTKRWVKNFFNATLLTPARRRGVFFGLWHFAFWLAIICTLGLIFFPSPDGINGTLALWAGVIGGKLLLTYTPHLSHSRFRRPLPGRQRRNP